MYFYLSLIPATISVIVGYFLLFTSAKAQGPMRVFGQVLTIWVFVVAALFPMAGAYATFANLGSLAGMMQSMHAGVSR